MTVPSETARTTQPAEPEESPRHVSTTLPAGATTPASESAGRADSANTSEAAEPADQPGRAAPPAEATTPAPPPLEVRGATKSFGSTVAVDDVDLVLDAGELLVLAGPSGCGKSTLLRLIAGLVGLDTGEIVVDGMVVDDGRRPLDPERRPVTLVLQDHNLFPHMTIEANVAFGMRHLRRQRKQRRAEARVLLDMVGIGHLAGRYPHEVSGGERQRAAVVRAIGPRPRLLLLDEPFASLDPDLRVQVRRDLVGMLRNTGTPAVLVSHDRAEALTLGDRIAVMRGGRIEQLAEPQTVYDAPANRFVAGFMGEACFLPVTGGPAGPSTELGPVGPVPLAGGIPPHGALAVIRPTDVTFVPHPEGTAEVVAAEYHGPAWTYELRLASGAVVRSVRATGRPVAVDTRVTPSLVDGARLALVADDGHRPERPI